MQLRLVEMIPGSLKKDPDIRAICESLQQFLDELWAQVDLLAIFKNFDRLPEWLIDHLAFQFHVDFYREDLSLDKKKALVRQSVAYHRYKGTPWAVENLLSTVFEESWIKEWFEYEGKPYYFRVYTKDGLKSERAFREFLQALYSVKNTRSWLDALILVREYFVKLYIGAVSRQCRKFTYHPFVGKVQQSKSIYIASIGRQIRRREYLPATVGKTNRMKNMFHIAKIGIIQRKFIFLEGGR